MTHTITSGATVITPAAVSGYESERAGGTLVHPVIGNPNPDITLRPGPLRTGRLTTVFLGATAEADSLTTLNALPSGAVFTLTSDLGSIAMTFVVPSTGTVHRAQSSTAGAWIVTVDYQEVAL